MNFLRLQKAARHLLLAAAVLLELLSFHPDILRDGNEAIATLFALIGIFAGISWKFCAPSAEYNPKRNVILEYLAIASGLALVCLLQVKGTFFSDGPSGADLSKLFWTAAVALLLIIASGFVLIASSRPQHLDVRKSSAGTIGARATAGTAITILLLLNLETRADIIVIANKARVISETQGFPFPAIHRLRMEHNPGAKPDDNNSISLPNGAHVERNREKMTVTRFRKETELPPADELRFRDGTFISFGNSAFGIILPQVEPIQVDLANGTASFLNSGTTYRSARNLLLNVVIATALIGHSVSASRRLRL